MKLFVWHGVGALVLILIAGVFYLPESGLPKSVVSAQRQFQKRLMSQVGTWTGLTRQMDTKTLEMSRKKVKERYEKEIQRLKDRKQQLQTELKKAGEKKQ